MKNVKTKIFSILTVSIGVVSVIMTAYNLYHEQMEMEQRAQQSYEFVHRSYDETLRDTVNFYTARANANLNSPGVLKAFREKDHNALYRLILPRWEVVHRENPSLIVMQFHNADGTSLLRVHQPDVYGDAIAKQRPMVAYAHRTQNTVSGFEEGRQGLAFRILVPVFDKGVYIGAVEFGIATPYFTDKIRRFAGYDSFFFVNENALGKFGRIKSNVSIGKYLGIDIPALYVPVLEEYAAQFNRLEDGTIHYNGQVYAANILQISNYQKKAIGAIMFLRLTDDFRAHVKHMIIVNFLIALVLIIVVGILVYWAYARITAKMSFQERYSQMILDSVPAPVIVTDGKELVAANDTFLDYFCFKNLEAFKEKHACVCDYFEEGDTDEYLQPMHDDRRWTEYMLEYPERKHKARITIAGKTTIFEVKISVVKFEENIRYVVIFNDISMIQTQSLTDPLTRIANRLHFTMVYEHAVNVAHRSDKPLSVIIFDIDHFKRVNDSFGHLEGDNVLKWIASAVSQRLRKSDLMARWGGEEFVILLPDTDLAHAAEVAEMIRQTIASEALPTVGHVSCSFGVSELKENDLPDDVLKYADEKLYEAKAGGRNRVVS